ncbi:MAG: hypothetical protein HYU02_02740 [Thaumarchaeota archaeon]|nr:hypothetical protein [Nitrososphaerota archaeon]
MARAEQITTDRKTMREILRFMEEAVKEGLNRKEIMSQIDLMLDMSAQRHIRQSEREIRQGKAKSFKSTGEAIEWLHSAEE